MILGWLGRMLVLPWGAASYGHLLEPILSLRPGVLMKGFFITFGLCNGGSGGQRRGATWRDVARRGVASCTKNWFKNPFQNLTLLSLLRRRRASPQENPRTRLDVLRQHDGGFKKLSER